MSNQRFLDGQEIRLTLTREERDFIYTQMSGRKQYFEEDMIRWASKNDTSEVLRCANAVEKINALQKKLLNP